MTVPERKCMCSTGRESTARRILHAMGLMKWWKERKIRRFFCEVERVGVKVMVEGRVMRGKTW